MSVQLQILQPAANSPSQQEFTANGTALCLANENITLNVLVLTLDLSFSLAKPAAVTPVQGLPGVHEWTVTFTANDGVPDAPYALYALAYANAALVAQADIVLGDEFLSFEKRKLKLKKSKKASKKK